MKPAISIVALALIASSVIAAQQPTFDVVSIKPSPSGAQNRLPRISPGRVELFNTTLKRLIGMAYSRFPFDSREIVGGPPWVDSERFDIVATMERPPQLDGTAMLGELSVMLRSRRAALWRQGAQRAARGRSLYTHICAKRQKDRRGPPSGARCVRGSVEGIDWSGTPSSARRTTTVFVRWATREADRDGRHDGDVRRLPQWKCRESGRRSNRTAR